MVKPQTIHQLLVGSSRKYQVHLFTYKVTALRSHRPHGSLHSKGTGQTCHSKAANLLTFVIVEAHSLILNINNYKVTALRSNRPRGSLHSKDTGQTCHSKAATLLTFVIVEAHSFTLNIKHNYKCNQQRHYWECEYYVMKWMHQLVTHQQHSFPKTYVMFAAMVLMASILVVIRNKQIWCAAFKKKADMVC